MQTPPTETLSPVPTATSPTIAPANAPTAMASLPGTAVNPAHGQPGHRCDIAVGAPLSTPVAASIQPTMSAPTASTTQKTITMPAQKPVVTAPGMNPPHGQAGHRCDVAVGAPLSSAPSKTAGSGTITKMEVPSAVAAPAPVATAPGMNPPHGQDGHRCDIAVGEPLPKE
ncbi:hypothetical protein [Flavobacterium sp. 3HN19-14]|uniref:hypothetical protein n=1 Tax=Flavobacterium sp. 3HN19-14 TaxID=3448133 RepID=UPI003EE32D13